MTMPPELFAVGAALFWASGNIAVKFATRAGSLRAGLTISLTAGTIALGTYAAAAVETWQVSMSEVALFALAGLAAAGGGRLLMMRAVRDAGTSVAVPVQASSHPVLASTAGIVLFGEQTSVGRVLALVLIIGGIWACVHGGSANRGEHRLEAHLNTGTGSRLLLLLWPLSAGAAFAFADVVLKFALTEGTDPILGALIGTAGALLLWLTIVLATRQLRASLRLNTSIGWFGLHGVLNATALASLLFALRAGDLSVVAPIVASQPVIVVLLGGLLLRRLEQLRAGTVAGAVVVFGGVAYLSVS